VALYLDGYRVGEIADVLGIRPKAASMRLARATGELRAHLASREGVDK
jgi:DNA-directed RNA polymerase specialized sigma24 family protein